MAVDAFPAYREVSHTGGLELANGTVDLTFTPTNVIDRSTLFSKDARGYGAGGHISAFIRDGRVEVQLQSASETYVLRSGAGSVRPGQTYHLDVVFGGQGFSLYLDGQLEASRADVTVGLAANRENLVIGGNTWLRERRNPAWVGDLFAGRITDFTIYSQALKRAEVAALVQSLAPAPSPTTGTTGTGLDRLVDIIRADRGLFLAVPQANVDGGAAAADAMNRIIVAAIRATGVANDGTLSAADLRDVNRSIRESQGDQWALLHGDDEDGVETGYHLVQGNGSKSVLFGDSSAIDTVGDGIYHLGFDICDDHLLNEDGAANASLADVASWLNGLLAKDLASGMLANAAVDLVARGTTGTGLDRLVDTIVADPGLGRSISTSQIVAGARSADGMSRLIVAAIRATGVANDGTLSPADLRDVNAYLRVNALGEWNALHGDDAEDGSETGFHLVQDDGASSRLFGDRNAVDTVADGIFHLGFTIVDGRFVNEDGNQNASLADAAFWLGQLLARDLAAGSLANAAVNLAATGTTGTGLDQLVAGIVGDRGLQDQVATSEIVVGARAADGMNRLIVAAIRATGAANDRIIDVADVRSINAYLVSRNAAQWQALHGDDTDSGAETGFHLVRGDGAAGRLYGEENLVDTVADGIYHLGFAIRGDRLLNEDGAANASLKDVAFWLGKQLAGDLARGSLVNAALMPSASAISAAVVSTLPSATVSGASGVVDLPHKSQWALPAGTISLAFTATTVTGRGTLFSKDAKGYGAGGHITVAVVDGRIEAQLQTTRETIALRTEPGSIRAGVKYQLSVSFGPDGFRLYVDGVMVAARADVTTGLKTNTERLVLGASAANRDPKNPKALGDFFAGRIDTFTVYRRALTAAEVALAAGPSATSTTPTRGTTGTGLDRLVDRIWTDPGLNSRVPANLAGGAAAADGMNRLIVAAIRATGVANDRTIDAADLRDVNAYLQANNAAEWVALHGDDEDGVETGYHLVQGDGATGSLFGDSNAIDTVGDGIYHLGFTIDGGRLLNEDGDANASLRSVAFWLGEFLEADLVAGRLANPAVSLGVTGTTGTGLDRLVTTITTDPGLLRRLPTSQIVGGARAADGMNSLIVAGIRATGIANDGRFSASDVRELNAYLRANNGAEWSSLHGDDEDGVETGYHLVQGDGGTSRLFGGSNAIDTVGDGLFHLGFSIACGRLLNEDGNANASLGDVAFWLEQLLAADLAAGRLANAAVDLSAAGSTGTGLDRLVSIVTGDRGLDRRISTSQIVTGARAADGMNKLVVEAIRATGAANDGRIDAFDVRDINAYLRANAAARWAALHGNDEGGVESGFHAVQGDGSATRLFGDSSAIDTVADGIYHLGFETRWGRFLNEDGAANASILDVAYWLDGLLAADLARGTLANPALAPNLPAIATTVAYAFKGSVGQ